MYLADFNPFMHIFSCLFLCYYFISLKKEKKTHKHLLHPFTDYSARKPQAELSQDLKGEIST